MVATEKTKLLLKKGLRVCGFELRRIAPHIEPGTLFDDPIEVIQKINSHEPAALHCPLAACVSFNAMSLSKRGWHPFVQTAREYIELGIKRYEDSSLKRYYDIWQPANARAAFIRPDIAPKSFENYPPFTYHKPWSERSPEESAARTAKIIEIENAEFGNAKLGPDAGHGFQGPVSEDKARLEYQRIVNLVDSIRAKGFDRWSGDIAVEVLEKKSNYLYVIAHGHHRAAVMSALGYNHIPAIPVRLLEEQYIAHWPSVYKKIWTHQEAQKYVNHLYDFDSLAWARSLGLPYR